jgi:glycosyltransferase A (GT-A) superfamily protein (DUF2064 family)
MAWKLPDDAVLGLWCERPDICNHPQLAADLGDDAAQAVLSAAFADRLAFWSNPAILADEGWRVVVFGPSDAGDWFDARVPPQFQLQPRETGELGAAVRSFFVGEIDNGAGRVVLLIGDSPLLDPSLVVGAFLALENRDVVIGPRSDGGIYLFGARRPLGSLSVGVSWNDSRFLGRLVGALTEQGASLTGLPASPGLKTADDWRAAIGRLRLAGASGMPTGLERLERLAALTIEKSSEFKPAV